jgi:hypothetical protein
MTSDPQKSSTGFRNFYPEFELGLGIEGADAWANSRISRENTEA